MGRRTHAQRGSGGGAWGGLSPWMPRIALIGAILVLPAAVVVARLGQLTVAEGDERLAEAQRRLVRNHWLPAERGSIVDRRGRVVAEDAPTYAVLAEYGVLTGAWAIEQTQSASAAVRRRYRLSDAAAAEVDRRCAAAVARHVELAWRDLASTLGVGRETLSGEAERIVARVQSMQRAVTRRREQSRSLEAIWSQQGLTATQLEAIRAAAAEPIAEASGSHRVALAPTDEVAFRVQRLTEEPAWIEVDLADLVDEADGASEAGRYRVEVPRLPGVTLSTTAERRRRWDRAMVPVDVAALPTPLRERAPASIEVVDGLSLIVGGVRREVYAEDHDRRAQAVESSAELAGRALLPSGEDRGAYSAGDVIGHFGLEAGAEDELRGLRGVRTTHLDTGKVDELPPARGADVKLTIDAALQARVQAGLDPRLGLATVAGWQGNRAVAEGTALAGAIVVLEIATGEVLAMASGPMPGTIGLYASAGDELLEAALAPGWNRAIAKAYPPGSIAKVVTLVEGVRQGRVELSERIACGGYLYEGRPDLYRCWLYKQYGLTHTGEAAGGLSGAEALKHSCNIYFYTLGQRMGPAGMRAAYESFGVGRAFGLGLGPESAGTIGVAGSGRLEPGEAILTGIGQGPVGWTPLHAADAVATIARGGVRVPVRVRMPERGAAGATPDESRSIGLARGVVEEAMRGLWLVVNDANGTGGFIDYTPDEQGGREAVFTVPGVKVWGKTGTAEASALVDDPDGPDGPRPARVLRDGDHGWYVALVGDAADVGPRYAIAVVLEYAGSGGRASGPVANWVVHALAAEGYLSGSGGGTLPVEPM